MNAMILPFGTLPSGTQASLYTIENGHLRAAFTDLGAALVSLCVNNVDIVLGYDTAMDYHQNPGFLGAIVGRNANRIKNAQFCLNGTTYSLTANSGPNNIHSGLNFYNRRIWDITAHTDNSIRFSLFSPDGDQGFPGNTQISVTYTLRDNQLSICYEVLSDQDTVCNLTNHSYFNLYGHQHPDLAACQTLLVNAEAVSATDENNLPTGEMCSVADSPLDFRKPAPLSQGLPPLHPALLYQKGYDHNYALQQKTAAVLCCPDSGLTMTVTTDCPGLQVYTANYLNVVGKNGVAYGPHSAVCLETQFFPDSVNHPHWRQPFIKANTPFHSETTFRFTFSK